MQINGSIVLYQNDKEVLQRAVSSFLDTRLEVKLYLIDNSPTDNLKSFASLDGRIEYIFNRENFGFGKAHNIALKKSIMDGVPYHLVLNPDVYFKKGTLEELYEYMQKSKDVANATPKIFYPNGEIQRLCRLLPTPFDLVVRRFINSDKIIQKINNIHELHKFNYDRILNLPFLGGCFMFLRVECLKRVGLFDENIFMYMEDLDLNRRLHVEYKTIFYPHVNIVHRYEKGSYKYNHLLFCHINSAIYYFNKHGWFFDNFRRKANRKARQAVEEYVDYGV